MKKITWMSTGLVFGELWGGGKGAYPARAFSAKSLKELVKLNMDALNDGSLDSGMGYQKLIGARLLISKDEEIIVNGKSFINLGVPRVKYIGELTSTQKHFLSRL